MVIVACDGKQFARGKPIATKVGNKEISRYRGFNSQLGLGVEIPDGKAFADRFIRKNKELQSSFGISPELPFSSSTELRRLLGEDKAPAYVDQLITDVQRLISQIHFSYVVLPRGSKELIEVGGFRCPTKLIPRNLFIDSLGPMFSYLTAYTFLYSDNFNAAGKEFHIDAFISKETPAWEKITHSTTPKVFFKGDECNPYICCADLIAYLTDVKLYGKHLRLEPHDLSHAWEGYSFNKRTNFLDVKTLGIYVWKTKRHIDFSRYLAGPTVYLMIDQIEGPKFLDQDITDLEDEDSDEGLISKPVRFKEAIKASPVYQAALKYAFFRGGSMKVFNHSEDFSKIRDKDILIYAGEDSRKLVQGLKDAYEVETYSGLELRTKVKGLSA